MRLWQCRLALLFCHFKGTLVKNLNTFTRSLQFLCCFRNDRSYNSFIGFLVYLYVLPSAIISYLIKFWSDVNPTKKMIYRYLDGKNTSFIMFPILTSLLFFNFPTVYFL